MPRQDSDNFFVPGIVFMRPPIGGPKQPPEHRIVPTPRIVTFQATALSIRPPLSSDHEIVAKKPRRAPAPGGGSWTARQENSRGVPGVRCQQSAGATHKPLPHKHLRCRSGRQVHVRIFCGFGLGEI